MLSYSYPLPVSKLGGDQTFLNSFPRMPMIYNFIESPGNHRCDIYPSVV